MADAEISRLRRLAAQGDTSAAAALERANARIGKRRRKKPAKIVWWQSDRPAGQRHVVVRDEVESYWTPAKGARSLARFIAAYQRTASYTGQVRCRATLFGADGAELDSEAFTAGPPEREVESDTTRLR